MDILQQLLHGALQLRQGYKGLFAGIAAGDAALALLHVLGADLYAQGHALHLVLGEFPAGGLVAVVHADADTGGSQPVAQGRGGLQHALLVLGDGDHHHLGGGDDGGQHQTVVVAVGHDDGADQAGGRAPACLERVLQGVVAAGEGHVIGAGELIAEEVAGAGLEGLVVLHHALDGVGGLGAGELLLVGLAALHHGHGQRVPAHVGVAVELLLRLGLGLGGGLVDGVALLPPELAGAQEGAGGLFPADNTAPLVIQHGQLAVAVEHVGPVVAEHGLRRGTEGQTLLQRLAAAVGDPGHLGGEALHQLALLFQQALGDQNGHGHIDVAGLFELRVHVLLDILPNGVAIRSQDQEALDAGVVHQLRLQADVRIPLGEILLHGSDRFHISLILSHVKYLSFADLYRAYAT